MQGAKNRILWLWLNFLQWASSVFVKAATFADLLSVGSAIRKAEAVALKSQNPDDARKLAELIYARSTMLPELCFVQTIMLAMLRQVERRQK